MTCAGWRRNKDAVGPPDPHALVTAASSAQLATVAPSAKVISSTVLSAARVTRPVVCT
jgi:hypothetical protein